jgi:hypothetical protein
MRKSSRRSVQRYREPVGCRGRRPAVVRPRRGLSYRRAARCRARGRAHVLGARRMTHARTTSRRRSGAGDADQRHEGLAAPDTVRAVRPAHRAAAGLCGQTPWPPERGYRGRKGSSPLQHIKNRVPISKRSLYINARRQPGHWEADYALFSRYGQSVPVAQERSSRFILLAKPSSRKAAPTAALLHNWLSPLPPRLRRTLSQDNGTEFADHHTLRITLGINIFFCNPHSPCQKAPSRTPTGVPTAFFLVKQTCEVTHQRRSMPSLATVMPPHGNALVSKPRPNYSPATCCTSDVNPPDQPNECPCRRKWHRAALHHRWVYRFCCRLF